MTIRACLKVAMPPEINFIYDKHNRMIGYGILNWVHPRTSPFAGEKIPTIGKLFTLGRHVPDQKVTDLVRRIELRMMQFGHFEFGAIVPKEEEHIPLLALLQRLGYTEELLTLHPDEQDKYHLVKKLSLLPNK